MAEILNSQVKPRGRPRTNFEKKIKIKEGRGRPKKIKEDEEEKELRKRGRPKSVEDYKLYFRNRSMNDKFLKRYDLEQAFRDKERHIRYLELINEYIDKHSSGEE
jgi:hypothetical protein